jgi:uncharacterized membrane protein YgcG
VVLRAAIIPVTIRIMKLALSLGVLTTSLLLAGSASAEKVMFAGDLRPENEVTPPVMIDNPTGGAVFVFDDQTKMLCGRIEYDGLTGAADGIHVHKAPKGMPNADSPPTDKVVIPVAPSGLQFKVKLTAEWEAALNAGEIYTNVHTKTNTKGEVRGTMDPFPEGEVFDCETGVTELPIGVKPDAGAPSDGGNASSSSGGSSSGNSSSSSSSGGNTSSSSSGGSGSAPLQPAEDAPQEESGGCSSTASSPANFLSVGLVATALVVLGARARRKKR